MKKEMFIGRDIYCYVMCSHKLNYDKKHGEMNLPEVDYCDFWFISDKEWENLGHEHFGVGLQKKFFLSLNLTPKRRYGSINKNY